MYIRYAESCNRILLFYNSFSATRKVLRRACPDFYREDFVL
jgi:hypothetical protein